MREKTSPPHLIHPLTSIAPAPWALRGSGVLLLRSWRRVVVLVHYEASPVGAYDEFAVIELSLCGPRVVEMAVNSAASCEAGRALWGFPKTLEDVQWRREGERILFRRASQWWRLRVANAAFPFRARAWTNQTRCGKKVRVPFAIRGRAGLSLRGRWTLHLDNFELRVFAPITNG